MFEPNCFFLVAGHASGPTSLNAFDAALIKAGVGDLNLIRLSSILPPDCHRIDPLRIPQGSLIPCAYAQQMFYGPGRVISAAVGVGVPKDPTQAGLIMECHNIDVPLEETEASVKQMVIDGMNFRERAIQDVLVVGSEHTLSDSWGAVFAGVVLWRI